MDEVKYHSEEMKNLVVMLIVQQFPT